MPALDSTQLALLRSAPQTSNWSCVPIPPVTIFAARVNGSPGVGAVTIPYDSVTIGAYTDALKGMTLLIGSAAGLDDYGVIRVRLDADASNLYVAWNSDIAWADNLYLTVLEQFLVWPVLFRSVGATIYWDWDIVYTDQTTDWPPVALMGDNVCKLWAGNPTSVYFPVFDSYPVSSGATLTSYFIDYGDGTSETVTTNPTHDYTSAGTRYAMLTVTDSNGKTHTTRRIVALPDPATIYTVKFEGTSLAGQLGEGWNANVRVFDPNASTAHFPDRAPCFIIAQDSFGGTSGSVGFPLDRENVVFFGYIVQDSVAIQPEYNDVTFELESIAGVMGRVDMQPVATHDSADPAGEPEPWGWSKNLTVFRAMAFMYWFHTTVMDIADVSIYNDTTFIKDGSMPADNLWNMAVQFPKAHRFHETSVTRTGRVVMLPNPNLIPVAARGAITTVCQLQYGDTREQITAPQVPYPKTSFLCLSGLVYDGNPANEFNPCYGMSPGHPPKAYGSQREVQFLALVNQTDANQLAGLLVGTDNMPYDPITIPLRGNWLGCFEPALQEYITTPSGGWTTKRGVILDAVPLIVRKVSVAFDWPNGVVNCTLTCDYTSVAEISTNGDCWPPDAPAPPTTIPPITIIVPPPTPTTSIPAPTLTGRACVVEPTTNTLAWTAVFNVDGYKVYRDAVLIATITNPTTRNYTDSGLSVDTAYTYTVRGYKASVNGTLSNSVVLTTCLTPVAFHNRAVMCTPNHVLEWSAFGGYGYTSDVPIDIKGNIVGAITDFQVNASGTYIAIANNQVWRYAGGSTWLVSDDAAVIAKDSCLWSTQFFPGEDGTGTHGLAWWGCRGTCSTGAPPCNTPHTMDTDPCIHFGYLAQSTVARLIGNHTTLFNTLTGVISDCGVKENGLWDVPVSAGVPGVASSPDDTTVPDLYSLGFGIFSHAISTPHHFSPYAPETFHLFLNDTDLFTLVNTVYLDGVDVTATWGGAPLWATNDIGDIWAWASGIDVRKNGVVVLATPATAGEPMSFNSAQGTNTRRTIGDSGLMHTSLDDGGTWTTHPVPSGTAANIFTADGDPNQLYVMDLNGNVYTSADEGDHWWENFAGVGESALGFWVDTSS